jgi:exonuclease SbcD
VGLAEEVDSRLFDCFDYAALGHLHRPQAIGPKARYPGSPLAYSFGEAGSDRGFLLVELGEEGARAEFLAHRPLHGLARLEGSFAELCLPGAGAGHREDFVEIRLTDSQPVLDPAEALRANFPYLLSIKQAAFELGRAGSGLAAPAELAADRDAADPLVLVEDFRLFHREMREGAEASEETLACLRGLVQEALDAAP